MPLDLFGDFGVVGAFDTPAAGYLDRQVCINFYPELATTKAAKAAAALLACPGLLALATGDTNPLPTLGNTWAQPPTTTNLPVRGFWVLPGSTTALAVIGNTIYLVSYKQPDTTQFPVISLNKVGNTILNSGPVSIRDNNAGGFAAIVEGKYGYFYDMKKQTVRQILDPAFLGADTVAFIDGWWIFNRPGTQTFYTNTPQYSTTFDGSFFALKDAFTDNLVAVFENKEELWLPGQQTTEIWYDAGGQYFPFSRLVGTMIQVGCKAAHSIARIAVNGQDSLIWFGCNDRGENIVVRTNGFALETVSTPAVSNKIAKYPYTADAIGYSYQEDTHAFYVLTFPTADATWVYDASMPKEMAWTQRSSYDPYTRTMHRHRSNCFMDFAGMRIVGDYQNGVIYQLTRNAYSDAAWPLLTRRRAPHIWSPEDRRRVFGASLQLEFAPGVGLSSGPWMDPQVNLRISRDGGKTFGQDNSRPLGQIGQYKNRTIWYRIGMARDMVMEFESIAPVSRDLVGATLRAQG